MTIYSCPLCSKCFNQKSHYDKHSKRIRPCVKGQNKGTTSKHTKISKKIETKPMSWYHDNMNEIFNFVVNDLDPCVKKGERKIIVAAEVKTGKRFIAQAYAVYNSSISGNQGETYAQIFMSSWVRRDDDGQRKELNAYFKGTHQDQRVFKINTEKSRVLCIKKIKDLLLKYDKVIVHHDELDYGSGTDQHMAAVYEFCINQSKICLIEYSATYEEAVVENSINKSSIDETITENTNMIIPNIKPVILKFTPPSEYRGVKWYCDNNLVYEATPFFENQDDTIILSEDAKLILKEAETNLSSDNRKENCKKLIIVRVNTHFEQTKDLIDSGIFPELCCHDDIRILPQFVHSRKELNTMTVKWDDYDWWKRQMEVERGYGKFLLILFIDQSSTRSTDWFCHPWLSFYHDYHPPTASVGSCGQSGPRPVYHTNKMCNGKKVYNDEEFFPKIYGQKDVFEYMAGKKKLNELKRPVSSRSRVFEKLNTFGLVMEIKFNEEEMLNFKEYIDKPLNDTSKARLGEKIESKIEVFLNKLKLPERKKYNLFNNNRTLKGKRTFNKDSYKAGGIYTVATNKIHNLNSGPGGGIGDEAYNNRGDFYWVDFALDDLEFTIENETIKIPRGTVYITYGIPDPDLSSDEDSDDSEDDDNDDDNKGKFAHRKTKKSMYSK
jgi:hypothetical protein